MSAMRIPAFGLLWLALAAAYLAASAFGDRAATLLVLGLMVGALVAASGQRIAGLVAGVALATAAWHYSGRVAFLAFTPPLAAFAFMAYFFGRTLRAGREPLIHRIARKDDSDLPADVARYTRRLTQIWTACFVVLFLVALGLAPLLPLEAWSRWVHGLGYLVPVALFVGEHAYREHRFPHRHRDTLAVMIPRVIAVMREAALESGAGVARAGDPQ